MDYPTELSTEFVSNFINGCKPQLLGTLKVLYIEKISSSVPKKSLEIRNKFSE